MPPCTVGRAKEFRTQFGARFSLFMTLQRERKREKACAPSAWNSITRSTVFLSDTGCLMFLYWKLMQCHIVENFRWLHSFFSNMFQPFFVCSAKAGMGASLVPLGCQDWDYFLVLCHYMSILYLRPSLESEICSQPTFEVGWRRVRKK